MNERLPLLKSDTPGSDEIFRGIFDQIAFDEPDGLEPCGLVSGAFFRVAHERGYHVVSSALMRWLAENGCKRTNLRVPRGQFFTGLVLRDEYGYGER